MGLPGRKWGCRLTRRIVMISDKETLEKVIRGEDVGNISNTGFLDKKTYYRLKEE